MINYYAVLDVLPNATPEVITQAYRRKAQAEHPDKNGDPGRFRAIQEAYEILSDPERRKRYDAGDDPTAAPLDAVSVLSQLCVQVVRGFPVDVDVIAEMRKHLLNEKDRAADSAETARRWAIAYERAADRIKRKTGENFLAGVMLGQAKQCRLQMAATAGAGERLDALLLALADFEYEAPPL